VISDKADAAGQASSQNSADITSLQQVVTDTTSSMASRLDELGARTDTANGGIQNNAIALITSTLAQVNQRTTRACSTVITKPVLSALITSWLMPAKPLPNR
jgi:hypothetical protein